MSWIGGLNNSFNQLSSITGQLGGQLSNFTKEVLADEDGEEGGVADFREETKSLRIKLLDVESSLKVKDVEIANHLQRISTLNEQLEDYRAELGRRGVVSHNKNLNFFNQTIDDCDVIRDVCDNDDVIGAMRGDDQVLPKLGGGKMAHRLGEVGTDGADEVKEVGWDEHELVTIHENYETQIRKYKNEIELLRNSSTVDTHHLESVERLTTELNETKRKLGLRNRQLQVQKKKIQDLEGGGMEGLKLKADKLDDLVRGLRTVLPSVEPGDNVDDIVKQLETLQHKQSFDHTMSPVHESSPVKGESPMGGAMSLTLQALQEQVADYELEIAQYEQVQHDWEIEKESLQKMLERYRSEIGVDATNDDINAGESLESVVVTNDNNGVETASEQRPVEALLGELKESELQLMEEKEQLQTTIKNLEDKLKSTVVESKEKLIALELHLEEVISQKKILEENFAEKSKKFGKVLDERNELEESIEVLDSQHQMEMEEILNIRNELVNQLHLSKQQVGGLEEDNLKLAAKVESLKIEKMNILGMTEKISQLERENQHFVEVMEEQVEEHMRELDGALGRMEEVEGRRRRLEEEQRITMGKVEELRVAQEEWVKMVGSKEEEVGILEAEVVSLRDAKVKMEDDLQTMRFERDEQAMLAEEMAAKIRRLERDDARDQLGQTKNDLSDARDQLGQTKNDLSDARDQLGQTKNDLSDARDQLGQTKNDLSDARDQLGQTRNDLSDARDQHFIENAKVNFNDSAESRPQGFPNHVPSLYMGGSPEVGRMLEEIETRDLSGFEKGELGKEDVGCLLQLIRERDDVIKILQETSLKETPPCEDEVQKLKDEKEQMLAVISEKTRENRQLKDEKHKFIDVIAAEKSALAKTQAENRELLSRYEGYDPNMTKEAVTKLSKLISDKDLEIMSWRQKCETLNEVLQLQHDSESSNNDTGENISSKRVQTLLRDREVLTGQVRQLLSERDHLVSLVNSKHTEVLKMSDNLREATASLEHDATENSRLQINYGNVVHDYEQLELKLGTIQRELVGFKESVNHLQEFKDRLSLKFEADGVVPPNGRSDEDWAGIIEKKQQSLLQKDLVIQEHMAIIDQLETKVGELTNQLEAKLAETETLKNEKKQSIGEISILKHSVENLREQVSETSNETKYLRQRVKSCEKIESEKKVENELLVENSSKMSIMLKEKEYEVKMLREKVSTLNEYLEQNQQGKDNETRDLMSMLDRTNDDLIKAKHQKDEISLTLKQQRFELQRANEESRLLRDKEIKLQSELMRLREHLIKVEEVYTQEALLSKDNEEELGGKMAHLVERVAEMEQIIEILGGEKEGLTKQRDNVTRQCQLLSEQSTRYATALQQLQTAAERMQREESETFAARVAKINQQLELKESETNDLTKLVCDLKLKLGAANEALVTASRLNEQLETKEIHISQLKQLVSEKQFQLDQLQDAMHSVQSANEGMVDKQLVKNLLVGYFGTTSHKQSDVMRLIVSVLGFSKEEENQINPRKSWGDWLSWKRTPPKVESADLNESFSQMFVKFLETESSSNHAELPASAMATEARLKLSQRKLAAQVPAVGDRSTVAGRYNPYTPSSPHQLMHPVAPTLPTFTPLTKSTEGNILQGILRTEPSS